MAIQKEFDLPDLSEEDMAGLVRVLAGLHRTRGCRRVRNPSVCRD